MSITWAQPGTIIKMVCLVNAKRTIENAIKTADNGDTIRGVDGIYVEKIVDKANLTITSENGPDNRAVQTPNPSRHVFTVTANGVEIIGFTVENATDNYHAGIYLYSVENCLIENNNCSNNYRSIRLIYTSHNTLSNNTCRNDNYGISLYSSSNNILDNNNCENNFGGISLYDNNTLTNNICENNFIGIYMRDYDNNTLTNNICENNNYDGMELYSSSHNTLTGNICLNNGDTGLFIQ